VKLPDVSLFQNRLLSRRSAVDNTGCVSCRNEALFANEVAASPTPQSWYPSHMIVAIKKLDTFTALYFNWSYLVLNFPA